ncbi:MAG: Matrixin, partial [Limisphaerales bacterium]
MTAGLVNRLRRTVCCLSAVLAALGARGQEATNGFAFGDFLLAPLRVHLLTATNEPAIHTTLTSNDVVRILGKVNRVWAQAGVTFYLESLHAEPAVGPTNYTERAREDERATLLALRPKETLATNCFHVFYLKQIRPNGVYFNAQGIFVKDTASLRPVEGGLDEFIPRVTAHELGHALTLPHRQYVTNLRSSGNRAARLNEAEIQQAREAAKQ